MPSSWPSCGALLFEWRGRLHQDSAVAECRYLRVVSDHDHRYLLAEPAKKRHYPIDEFWIKVRSWFVSDYQLDIASQHARDCDSLALTTGEFVDLPIRKLRQADLH
jgi:hypothetical protein